MKVIKKDDSVQLIDDTIYCRFFPQRCKMSPTAETIAKVRENPEEYELALRPEPDSIACTNCLLVQLLSFLREQEGEECATVIEVSKEDVKALKRHFKNAK